MARPAHTGFPGAFAGPYACLAGGTPVRISYNSKHNEKVNLYWNYIVYLGKNDTSSHTLFFHDRSTNQTEELDTGLYTYPVYPEVSADYIAWTDNNEHEIHAFGTRPSWLSGGGGSGAECKVAIIDVTNNNVVEITIGSGGSGGAAGGTAGSNGSQSTFGSLLTALGGRGGTNNMSAATSFNKHLTTGDITNGAGPGGYMNTQYSGTSGAYGAFGTPGTGSAGAGACPLHHRTHRPGETHCRQRRTYGKAVAAGNSPRHRRNIRCELGLREQAVGSIQTSCSPAHSSLFPAHRAPH